MNLDKFKPDLIPNHPKNKPVDLNTPIMKNGGYSQYLIPFKKDGVRLQLLQGKVLSRTLEPMSSILVQKRFEPIAKELHKLGIAADGEFYMHGQKFNSIFRFYSKLDVTNPEYKIKLKKEFKKNPEKFADKYDGLDIEFLTTFHDDLKFWLFDGIILDRPDLVGFKERMEEIVHRICLSKLNENKYIQMPEYNYANSKEELDLLYKKSLSHGYEGLVLVHKDHKYKFGRGTLNEGSILKMKDDRKEFDGIILDVEEATVVKDGVEKTVNNLGRSVTSKKKGDRLPSGLAKGFVVQYENIGTFTVGLTGFDNEAKKELLDNKGKYIGRHFKYTGMPPVKDYPRSAFFDCWRDEK